MRVGTTRGSNRTKVLHRLSRDLGSDSSRCGVRRSSACSRCARGVGVDGAKGRGCAPAGGSCARVLPRAAGIVGMCRPEVPQRNVRYGLRRGNGADESASNRGPLLAAKAKLRLRRTRVRGPHMPVVAGTAFFRAYAFDPHDPDYLWAEDDRCGQTKSMFRVLSIPSCVAA